MWTIFWHIYAKCKDIFWNKLKIYYRNIYKYIYLSENVLIEQEYIPWR